MCTILRVRPAIELEAIDLYPALQVRTLTSAPRVVILSQTRCSHREIMKRLGITA